jgi:hypothetical protein
MGSLLDFVPSPTITAPLTNGGKTLGSLLDLAPPPLCHGSVAEPATFTYEVGDLVKIKDPGGNKGVGSLL